MVCVYLLYVCREAVALYVGELKDEFQELSDAASRGDWETVYDIMAAHKGNQYVRIYIHSYVHTYITSINQYPIGAPLI